MIIKPLIREGILFTNDPILATSVLTILVVGKSSSDFTNFFVFRDNIIDAILMFLQRE